MITKAFENQSELSDRIEEYWNIYNAIPDANLMYNGNSPGYVPVCRDCVDGRTRRTLKALFPANHKHVDGVSDDGSIPYTQLSLIEHYIRKSRLKSIVRTDLVAGDVTGQWNLMVDWLKSKRRITELVKRNPIIDEIDGEDVRDMELRNPLEEEVEEAEESEVIEEGPDIVDFAAEDLVVIPPTCTDMQKAKCVAIRLRLSKQRVEELVDEGTFILPDGWDIDQLFATKLQKARRNRAKQQANDAGVRTEGTDKHLLVYMAYSRIKLDGDYKDSAITYFSGPDQILGLIKNPLWSGKIPILSEPCERVQGSYMGKSKIEPVKYMQWQLVDFWNMGQDAGMYSMLPVWAVDPLKTPQWQTMVMGLAALWPVAPSDIKPLTQPQLWKEAHSICAAIKAQIWESMGVNEMMMGKTPSGRKNNAMIGNMQQEQATNISDHAERYEEVMLNPLIEMLFEFDQQFRTDDVTIEARGEIGAKAAIEVIPPQQWDQRFFFRWAGTTFAMNMQRMQQMTGWVNVIKGIPPQMLNGRKLDMGPFVEMGTENIFGPQLAPKILIDQRNLYTISPEIENEILHNGMPVQVHEADNDSEHLQSHMVAANASQDPQGLFRQHMVMHTMGLQAKREKDMAQQGGVPGSPGGAGPGAAGSPRPGAQPAPGRPAQAPPGAIQQDHMPGAPGRG